jgi:ribonuclease HIII
MFRLNSFVTASLHYGGKFQHLAKYSANSTFGRCQVKSPLSTTSDTTKDSPTIIIAGVDEAGRGALFGPMVIGKHSGRKAYRLRVM